MFWKQSASLSSAQNRVPTPPQTPPRIDYRPPYTTSIALDALPVIRQAQSDYPLPPDLPLYIQTSGTEAIGTQRPLRSCFFEHFTTLPVIRQPSARADQTIPLPPDLPLSSGTEATKRPSPKGASRHPPTP